MKPTMSKDGLLRFNLRIVARIGRYELINIVARKLSRCEFDEVGQLIDPPKFTRRLQVLDLARETIGDVGDGYDYWADSLWAGRAEGIRDMAEKIVDRLFPELREEKDAQQI